MACEIIVDTPERISIGGRSGGTVDFSIDTVGVNVETEYWPTLDAPACRKLAEWAIRAAERMEAEK